MKRILVISSLLTLISGCSFIGLKPVPRQLASHDYPQCLESMSPVIVDICLGMALGLLTVKQIQSNIDEEKAFAFGFSSAAFFGSSIYGSVLRRRCMVIRREAEEVIHPPYLPVPTNEVPAPSPPESGH